MTNIDEVLRTNEKKQEICGVKVFMGSSTGNLLVDSPLALDKVFAGRIADRHPLRR
jgi:dihydroorotase